MWICYSLCRTWSLHWQHYGRIRLVRSFGSITLPIAGLHCIVNARNGACSAPNKGGGLINAGSPKEGRFCKTKRLVEVDGDGSFDITCDCLRSRLDRQCEECEAKCFSNQRKTQFGSSDNNISKSDHNDTYHENNRKIQRKIRHYTNPSQVREMNIVFSAMRLAEHSFCGARWPTAIRRL